MTKYIKLSNTFALAAVAGAMAMLMTGCGSQSSNDTAGGEAGDEKIMIQNAGSDTMVNLEQAWAQNYAKVNPKVSIEVSGGGSGTGIAALINGTTDIANCSRDSGDHIWYEATLDDPQTWSEPWTIEMMLYRHVEENAQILEHKCVEFADKLLYSDLLGLDKQD